MMLLFELVLLVVLLMSALVVRPVPVAAPSLHQQEHLRRDSSNVILLNQTYVIQ
jgi:hypothetical protein